MDEREAWQPKIFYSDPGPEQGLPEPFPAPTHLRRKERSSHNRGTLYVPNTPSGGLGVHGQQHGSHSGRRRQEFDDRSRNDRNRHRAANDQAPHMNGMAAMFADSKASRSYK